MGESEVENIGGQLGGGEQRGYISKHVNSTRRFEIKDTSKLGVILLTNINSDGIEGTTVERTLEALFKFFKKIFFEKIVKNNYISLNLA